MNKLIPDIVKPMLEFVQANLARLMKVSPDSIELEFWTDKNDQVRERGFDWLIIELGRLDIEEFDFDLLPIGYRLVAYLLNWEYECQSEGWAALDNFDGSMEKVIPCYHEVGLPHEAEAVLAAYKQWKNDPSNLDEIRRAYRSIGTEIPDGSDRIDFLLSYLIDNSRRLFYALENGSL